MTAYSVERRTGCGADVVRLLGFSWPTLFGVDASLRRLPSPITHECIVGSLPDPIQLAPRFVYSGTVRADLKRLCYCGNWARAFSRDTAGGVAPGRPCRR